jgi:tight adherence protein B
MSEQSISRVRRLLERSDWALSPGEFAVVSGAAAVVAGALGLLLQGPLVALLLAVAAGVAPYVTVLRSVARRRSAFDEQFPDLLDLLAGSLDAGSSVPQALQLVVEELDAPASHEFGRVLAATTVGVPFVEALATAAHRIGSSDLDWTVQAVAVQQRTGGRLADILRIVAGTMRDRAEMQRELRSLTAEGRLSAYVLGGLPIALTGVLLVLNPGYLAPLFGDPLGLLMVAGAGVLMLVAFAWMRRVVKVEV